MITHMVNANGVGIHRPRPFQAAGVLGIFYDAYLNFGMHPGVYGICWGGDGYYTIPVGTSVLTRFQDRDLFYDTQVPLDLVLAAPSAMTAAGPGKLYIADTATATLYRYGTDGLYAGLSLYVGAEEPVPTAVAWDGTYLWVAGGISGQMHAYDPASGYTGISILLTQGEVDPQGLDWDGFKFWVLDASDGIARGYDPQSGSYTGSSFLMKRRDSLPADIAWSGVTLIMVYTNSILVEQYV